LKESSFIYLLQLTIKFESFFIMHKIQITHNIFLEVQMVDGDALRVVGLCGSLRYGSYNLAILKEAGRQMPRDMLLDIVPWDQVPLYGAHEQSDDWPEAVVELGSALRHADAVLIACPEYNFGIPGGFKNALDWLSRLPLPPFRNLPVALLGASTGPLGTARVQYELRRVLHCMDAHVLGKPEIFVGNAKSKFDASGQLTDEITCAFVKSQMQAFRLWMHRLRSEDQLV
jgi:chromate reductase, NAD(P)H dehydrogenase (quinone)